MYPDLFVARHGETEWNLEGRLQGTDDSPLTELGVTQAQRLTALFQASGVGPDTHDFRTSPQGRARRTAEIALRPLGVVARADPRLVEIDIGVWSGLTRPEIDARWPAPDPHEHFLETYDRAPEGEGFDAVFARCTAFLKDLRRPTVVITHGITSRVLRTVAMGWGPDRLRELPGGQGVLHVVRQKTHETRTP